jgi:hypothetical protein
MTVKLTLVAPTPLRVDLARGENPTVWFSAVVPNAPEAGRIDHLDAQQDAGITLDRRRPAVVSDDSRTTTVVTVGAAS